MKWLTLMMALAVLPGSLAAAEEKIQLAILLDTSNSMDGLIDQAKSQLWKVVNELARTKRNGRHPQLEVALFEYGNDGLEESDGYIRLVSNLTTDLDRISENLFGLTTNGGSEYCGMVIDKAVGELAWSSSADVLKVIYIAGNEEFTQGKTSYRLSDAKAARKGIIVNTIFCGSYDEGVATFWKDGALRGEGRYMSIDQGEVVQSIPTPYDEQIVRLGASLNGTYLGYGSAGEASKERQAAQDANAASMGAGSTVERSVAKAQAAYTNSGWDLLDALQSKAVTLGSLKETDLPPEMRSMTLAQKDKYIRDLAAKRAELQAQINTANEKRREYVAAEMQKRTQQNTLDQAILTSVREEAQAKGYTTE